MYILYYIIIMKYYIFREFYITYSPLWKKGQSSPLVDSFSITDVGVLKYFTKFFCRRFKEYGHFRQYGVLYVLHIPPRWSIHFSTWPLMSEKMKWNLINFNWLFVELDVGIAFVTNSFFILKVVHRRIQFCVSIK